MLRPSTNHRREFVTLPPLEGESRKVRPLTTANDRTATDRLPGWPIEYRRVISR